MDAVSRPRQDVGAASRHGSRESAAARDGQGADQSPGTDGRRGPSQGRLRSAEATDGRQADPSPSRARPLPPGELAADVARLLDEHKASDTVVLEVAGLTDVADYFVIATARSSAHLAGLARELDRQLDLLDRRPLNRHKRAALSGWLLVDCGDVVVHLMERESRDFYDLERLWFRAAKVPYSSKSS